MDELDSLMISKAENGFSVIATFVTGKDAEGYNTLDTEKHVATSTGGLLKIVKALVKTADVV